MGELLKPYISQIILAISGIAAWLFERNKRKEDLKSAQMQNIQAVVDLYQEALSDLKIRYDGTITELKKEYDFKFLELDKNMKNLRDNVNLWKAKYRKLKDEFDTYKSKHGEK